MSGVDLEDGARLKRIGTGPMKLRTFSFKLCRPKALTKILHYVGEILF